MVTGNVHVSSPFQEVLYLRGTPGTLETCSDLAYKSLLGLCGAFAGRASQRAERGTMSTVMAHAPKGLEGVVATTSKICYIDGDQGVLAYRGIDIHELADNSTFEETCYLLWNGSLPRRSELKDLEQRLAAERKVDPAIIEFLRNVPKGSSPMDPIRRFRIRRISCCC